MAAMAFTKCITVGDVVEVVLPANSAAIEAEVVTEVGVADLEVTEGEREDIVGIVEAEVEAVIEGIADVAMDLSEYGSPCTLFRDLSNPRYADCSATSSLNLPNC